MEHGTEALRLSVVIATYNRPHLLGRALTHLAGCHDPPDEVVVVNGGDDLANEVVARSAASFPRLVLLQCPNRNPATSRNLGLRFCHGDIVAITDDDAVVAADWTAQIKRAHVADPSAGAIGGPVFGLQGNTFLSRVADCMVFQHWGPRRRVRTLPTVNISYKRSVLEQVGTFDEAFSRCEDADLCWRIICAGYQVVYDPAIRVHHKHRDTLLGLLEQQYRYGRGWPLLQRRWLETFVPNAGGSSRRARMLRLARHTCSFLLAQPAAGAMRMPTVAGKARALPILLSLKLAWITGVASALALSRSSALGTSIHWQQQTARAHVQLFWEWGRLVDHGEASRPLSCPREA